MENDTPLTKNDRFDFISVPEFAYLRERKRRRCSTNLYYQRTSIQPAAGDGRSSTKVVLPEGEKEAAAGDGRCSTTLLLPSETAGRRRRPFQYVSCTTRERKTSRPPATAVAVLKLYYQRASIQPAAGDGRSSIKVVLPKDETSSRPKATAVPEMKLYYQRTKIQPAAGAGRSSTKVVLPQGENSAGGRRQPFQY